MEPKLEDLPLLSPSEWRIFSVLARESGPVTIRELQTGLSRLTGDPLPSGQVLVLVQRLMKKGYAQQRPLQGTNAHQYWAIQPYSEVLRRQAERWLAELTLGEPQTLAQVRILLDDLVDNAG